MDNAQEIDVGFEEEARVDISYEEGGEFKIDGVGEYAFGMWTKFLMTSPNRVYEKAEFHHIARLTTNKQEENTDFKKSGDRTLSVLLHTGVYIFATYNADIGNVFKDISYGE